LAKRRLTEFERCALASRLLTREQLADAWYALDIGSSESIAPDTSETEEHIESPTDEELADKLVELGQLNFWQSRQLLEGRKRFNLGPYRILDSLGRGGMGQVFKCEHDILRRAAAIKVLPREKATPEAIANFQREIQAQAKLDHPNLVRALDAGQDGNVFYMVAEYVPGSDLRKLVRRNGPLNMEAAASIVSQVAAALQYAHQQGLIHRDVKPGNVLVTPDGHAKLSDLGLAGPLEGDIDEDPRFGRIAGTADYLSPDHIRDPWNPTPAWDIYSLGCTLYYAVTGKVPFPKGSTRDKARAHCELRPLDPRRLNASLSAAFVDVLADMMAKDPAERIQSAAEVIQRLAPWTLEPAPLAPGSRRKRKSSIAAPVPPPKAFRSGEPDSPERTGLEDTKSSFPEFSDVFTGSDDYAPEPIFGDSRKPPSLLRPFLILVATPAILVGLMMLLGWLLTRTP
jgi:serine/threonine protein kinase